MFTRGEICYINNGGDFFDYLEGIKLTFCSERMTTTFAILAMISAIGVIIYTIRNHDQLSPVESDNVVGEEVENDKGFL